MAELTLKPSDARLGLAPISKIKTSLDRLFGKDVWLIFEPETLSIELGLVLDELLLDKIQVLQILLQDPESAAENAEFLLHATDVINNQVADFETVPMPTSLELAFALSEMNKVLEENGQKFPMTSALTHTVAWLLRQEGYSKPLPPFDFVPENMLELGQTPADTENKRKAIEAYLAHMENV